MKKILTLLLSSFVFILSANAQVTSTDLQGSWTLTALEGNDSSVVLTPEELQVSSENYLHDFPLTSTTLTLTNNDFGMTHHHTGHMGGTFDVADPILTLHAVPDGCSSCAPKDFVFIIHSYTTTELVIDIFDENEGSSKYARLTLTK